MSASSNLTLALALGTILLLAALATWFLLPPATPANLPSVPADAAGSGDFGRSGTNAPPSSNPAMPAPESTPVLTTPFQPVDPSKLAPDGFEVSGVVLDTAGEFLEGVDLVFHSIDVPPNRFEATTDAHGRFSARCRVLGAFDAFLFCNRIFEKHSISIRGIAGESFTITMARGQSVAGRILDEDGQALSDAWLCVTDSGTGSSRDHTARPDGRFRIPGLLGDRVAIAAGARGHVAEERKEVLVPGTEPLEFRLRRGIVISGVVLDARTLLPKTNFAVDILPADHDSTPVKMATLDPMLTLRIDPATGTFSTDFGALAPGHEYLIRVAAPDSETAWIRCPKDHPLNGAPPLRILLGAGIVVTGHVTSLGTGEAVEDAVVAAPDDFERHGGKARENHTRSDAEGRFSLSALGAHVRTLEVRHPGYLPERIDVGAGTVDVDIEVAQCAFQTMKAVRLPPILLRRGGRARIEIQDAAGTVDAGTTARLSTPRNGVPEVLDVPIAPDGTGTTPLLPPGNYTILVQSPRADLDGLGARFELAAGEEKTIVVVPNAHAEIVGLLTSDPPIPEEVVVTLRLTDDPKEGKPRELATVVAGADGKFRFGELEAGSYGVHASYVHRGRNWSGSTTVKLKAGPNPVSIHLVPR